MKKFTLITLCLAVICWIVSGVMLITFGEKGFEDMSQEIVGTKLIQFETKTQDLDAAQVQNLDEIELASANSSIEIEASDDAGLHVEYPGMEKPPVQEKIEGKKIKYDFTHYFEGSENKMVVRLFKGHGFIHIGDVDSGKIIVKIPKNIKKIKGHTISGDFRITTVNAATLRFDSTSGDLRVKNSNLSKVEATSMSGDLRVQGYVQNADLKTESGDVKIQSENRSPVMTVNTASGEVNVDFLETPEVKITFDTASGEMSMDADGHSKSGAKNKKDEAAEIKKHNVYTIGKGTGVLKIRTASGDARVRALSGIF
jgi:hypothetical protein